MRQVARETRRRCKHFEAKLIREESFDLTNFFLAPRDVDSSRLFSSNIKADGFREISSTDRRDLVQCILDQRARPGLVLTRVPPDPTLGMQLRARRTPRDRYLWHPRESDSLIPLDPSQVHLLIFQRLSGRSKNWQSVIIGLSYSLSPAKHAAFIFFRPKASRVIPSNNFLVSIVKSCFYDRSVQFDFRDLLIGSLRGLIARFSLPKNLFSSRFFYSLSRA